MGQEFAALQGGLTPFYRFNEAIFFLEIAGDDILHDLGRVKTFLGSTLCKSRLQIGSELNFHGLKIRIKLASRQGRDAATRVSTAGVYLIADG